MSAANGTRPRPMDARAALRERRALVLGVPAALVALTLLFVFWVRPAYESQASVRIDEQKSSVQLIDALTQLQGGSQVATEMAVLRSRSITEDVVRELSLQVDLVSPRRTLRSAIFAEVAADTAAPEGQYTLTALGDGRFRLTGEIVERLDQPRPFERPRRRTLEASEVRIGEPVSVPGVSFTLAPAAADHGAVGFAVATFQDVVEAVQENTAVGRPDREAGVVVVGFRGADPELVQAVPNALVRRFIEVRRIAQSAEARGTVGFLGEQIDSLGRQLADAEEALRAFREANEIVSVEAEADAQVRRLAETQARRDALIAERDALGRMLEEVREETRAPGEPSPFRKLMSFPTLLQNTASAEMLGQLVGLENQRAQLLMTRTPEDRDVRLVDQRVAELETQLRVMAETYWRGLGEQVRTLGDGLAGFEGELARIPAQEMNFVRMLRQAELLAGLHTLLQTKQKEAEVTAAVQDQSVSVVDPAVYPTRPVRPRPWQSLFLALAAGLVLGIGGALAAEHLDRTVRDRNGLQAATGAAVLGLIPIMPQLRPSPLARLRGATNGNGAGTLHRLVGQLPAGDPATEAYRSLRTNLSFVRPAAPPKALVFTSPMPGDGKSTTAANFALVLAQQGGRVVLVDSDMRRGALHELLGERGGPGVANVLLGLTPLDEVVRKVPLDGGRTLDFIPSGVRPPNPSELLSSEAMTRLLRTLGERYDTVVLDAPPLNLVTDAALMGVLADGVVLVARAGVTEQEPLAYAVEQIERVRAPLLGTVLNGVDERRQAYYGGGTRGYFERG